MKILTISLTLFTALFWLGVPLGVLLAHEKGEGVKTMTAIRADSPPTIDGILDDEVWQRAPVSGDFLISEPAEKEGQPASEPTTIRVAYDDHALYIAVLCYDSEPEKIIRRLYRRDAIHYGETDWLGIRLDPHHDHQTGFGFAVTPSGSYTDNIIVNDSEFNGSWDSVWEVRTAIQSLGWSAEFRIPYHALRFSPKDEYVWGINLDRRVIRKQEYTMWNLARKGESGISSRNGHLVGIRGIQPPKHLEFLPYTVASTTVEAKNPVNPDGREYLGDLGADVRYGVASNVSLNATINPDFGQVEADPAVLNLTVFETFFEERRPFFVEGSQMFQTPFTLFYSRRIGRQPGRFPVRTNGTVVGQPKETTILGAAKLTGKTAGKTSFGIVEAVTAREYATVKETINGEKRRRDHLIEPLTNYFVGRLQQDVLQNSTVGLLATSVHRRGEAPAYTSGFDWHLRFRNNAYSVSGQLAGSRTGNVGNRENGYAASIFLGKQSGWFTTGVDFEAISPDFDANDLGFTHRPDVLMFGPWMDLRRLHPWGPFRDAEVWFGYWEEWSYEWVNRGRTFHVESNAQFENYWSMAFSATHTAEALNDWKTRGGPFIVEPASTSYSLTARTDSRRPISVRMWADWAPAKEGRQKYFSVGVTLRPIPTLDLHVGPGYRRSSFAAEWVTNVDDDGDGVDDHFIFGELMTNEFEVTTRANLILTPRLSVQLYMQPFITTGDYENFKELARPKSFEFTPYPNVSLNPDFHQRSLRGNLVLRWEYRPGSTLFLVWSQSRSRSGNTPTFRPMKDLGRTFLDAGTNVFFVKLNYRLGM